VGGSHATSVRRMSLFSGVSANKRARSRQKGRDLDLSWSSPRIHWLPWADLGWLAQLAPRALR
jgi:hypothetical protein